MPAGGSSNLYFELVEQREEAFKDMDLKELKAYLPKSKRTYAKWGMLAAAGIFAGAYFIHPGILLLLFGELPILNSYEWDKTLVKNELRRRESTQEY